MENLAKNMKVYEQKHNISDYKSKTRNMCYTTTSIEFKKLFLILRS